MARGPDHEDTILTMYSLGVTLRQEGKLDEAEAMSRDAVAHATKALAPDHRWRITAVIGLGQALTAQKRFGEAETTLMLTEAALRPAGPDASGANAAARARYLKWAKALDELYGKGEEAEPGAHAAQATEGRATVKRLEDAARQPAPGK